MSRPTKSGLGSYQEHALRRRTSPQSLQNRQEWDGVHLPTGCPTRSLACGRVQSDSAHMHRNDQAWQRTVRATISQSAVRLLGRSNRDRRIQVGAMGQPRTHPLCVPTGAGSSPSVILTASREFSYWDRGVIASIRIEAMVHEHTLLTESVCAAFAVSVMLAIDGFHASDNSA